MGKILKDTKKKIEVQTIVQTKIYMQGAQEEQQSNRNTGYS